MSSKAQKQMFTNLGSKTAKLLLGSPLGRRGEQLWRSNEQDFLMPLSKWQKALITFYLVIRDLQKGEFPPPVAGTMEEAHEREIQYLDNLPGTERSEMDILGLSKPFWGGKQMSRLLADFCRIESLLNNRKTHPPSRILELGCGAGWLSELLARNGYEVLGTTLDPKTVSVANRRATAFALLSLQGSLRFKTAAMERLSADLAEEDLFDAIIIYEALHHVHDWRQSLTQAASKLCPGGLLLIANEPNLIHTVKSYRVAKLTGTREIGLNRKKLAAHLSSLGFKQITYPRHHLALGIRPIWISAIQAGMEN